MPVKPDSTKTRSAIRSLVAVGLIGLLLTAAIIAVVLKISYLVKSLSQ